VTDDQIAAQLGAGETKPDDSVQEFLSYHGEGHFHAWEVRLDQQPGTWILKSPTHEDAERKLYRDLGLARLGDLFRPAITPQGLLTAVMTELIGAGSCLAHEQGEPHCEKQIAAPMVFVSKRLGRAYKGNLPSLDPESIARVVAFGCWVGAKDSEFVDGLDGRAYSIDHADSLCWTEGDDANASFGDLARLDDGSLKNAALYTQFVAEVSSFAPEAIVRCFVGIPTTWLGSHAERAQALGVLIKRQQLLEPAVHKYVSG
jgi:hypothetical protein